jgi:hypothetical protein
LEDDEEGTDRKVDVGEMKREEDELEDRLERIVDD